MSDDEVNYTRSRSRSRDRYREAENVLEKKQEPEKSNEVNSTVNNNNENAENYTIYIGNLNPLSTSETLSKHFSSLFGEVKSCDIMLDPHTGASRQFAFISFVTNESKQKALNYSNSTINNPPKDLIIDDYQVKVSHSNRGKPHEKTPGVCKYYN